MKLDDITVLFHPFFQVSTEIEMIRIFLPIAAIFGVFIVAMGLWREVNTYSNLLLENTTLIGPEYLQEPEEIQRQIQELDIIAKNNKHLGANQEVKPLRIIKNKLIEDLQKAEARRIRRLSILRQMRRTLEKDDYKIIPIEKKQQLARILGSFASIIKEKDINTHRDVLWHSKDPDQLSLAVEGILKEQGCLVLIENAKDRYLSSIARKVIFETLKGHQACNLTIQNADEMFRVMRQETSEVKEAFMEWLLIQDSDEQTKSKIAELLFDYVNYDFIQDAKNPWLLIQCLFRYPHHQIISGEFIKNSWAVQLLEKLFLSSKNENENHQSHYRLAKEWTSMQEKHDIGPNERKIINTKNLLMNVLEQPLSMTEWIFRAIIFQIHSYKKEVNTLSSLFTELTRKMIQLIQFVVASNSGENESDIQEKQQEVLEALFSVICYYPDIPLSHNQLTHVVNSFSFYQDNISSADQVKEKLRKFKLWIRWFLSVAPSDFPKDSEEFLKFLPKIQQELNDWKEIRPKTNINRVDPNHTYRRFLNEGKFNRLLRNLFEFNSLTETEKEEYVFHWILFISLLVLDESGHSWGFLQNLYDYLLDREIQHQERNLAPSVLIGMAVFGYRFSSWRDEIIRWLDQSTDTIHATINEKISPNYWLGTFPSNGITFIEEIKDYLQNTNQQS